MTTHHALASPQVLHPGDMVDCGPCRSALLSAFRPPADVPEPAPSPVRHDVRSTVLPDIVAGAPSDSGFWQLRCPCGYQEEGRYGDLLSPLRSEQAAIEYVRLRAVDHTDRPEARPHLRVEGSARTVRLGTPEHRTGHAVVGNPDRPGTGLWKVSCSCGWAESGLYGPGLLLSSRMAATLHVFFLRNNHLDEAPNDH